MSWSTSELRVNRFKPYSKIFFLTVPRQCFFCGSFMSFLSCICYAFVRFCLLMPCGHLLGKGWPLGFRLWCLIVKLSLNSHWYMSWVDQVWCLIVSIPDLCPLSYFDTHRYYCCRKMHAIVEKSLDHNLSLHSSDSTIRQVFAEPVIDITAAEKHIYSKLLADGQTDKQSNRWMDSDLNCYIYKSRCDKNEELWWQKNLVILLQLWIIL